MMFSGFQSSIAQNNAFQIISGGGEPQEDFQILGGVISTRKYEDDDIERLRRQYADNERQMRELNAKLAAEQEKIDKLQNLNDNIVQVDAFEANQADALYLAAVAQAQIEIKRLQSMKAALMRMLDEEEAIMVILLSHPFYH